MTNFTAKDLDVLSHILTGEEMACKKARIYANTLQPWRRKWIRSPARTPSALTRCLPC